MSANIIGICSNCASRPFAASWENNENCDGCNGYSHYDTLSCPATLVVTSADHCGFSETKTFICTWWNV